MIAELILNWMIGALGAILALLIKHMFDCRQNSNRLTRIEDHLKLGEK